MKNEKVIAKQNVACYTFGVRNSYKWITLENYVFNFKREDKFLAWREFGLSEVCCLEKLIKFYTIHLNG